MAEMDTYDNPTINNYETDGSKISIVESVVIVLISLSGDFADLIGVIAMSITGGVGTAVGWIPVVGWLGASAAAGVGTTTYFLCKAFSLFVWAIIALWASFRDAKGGMSSGKKILSLCVGKGVDESTFGILPIQTASVIFTIFYNNKIKGGGVKEN